MDIKIFIMKRITLIITILFCFGILSCEKDFNEAEWGTFKCKINGKEFHPSTTLGGNVQPINVYYCPTGSQRYFNYPRGHLSIQGIDARYSLDIAGSVCIQKIGVFGVGEYPLTFQECENFYSCDASWYYKSNEWDYFTKEGNYFAESGKLTITKLDTIERRISGTFYFDAKDIKGHKKKITNGVFNVKYGLIKSDGSLAD